MTHEQEIAAGFADVLGDEKLAALHTYWSKRRGAGSAPSRQQIDPAEIPNLLPWMVIVDVEEGMRFRYRLLGTEIVRTFGCDATWRCIDEVMDGAYRDFLIEAYATTVREKAPVFTESVYRTQGVITKRLFLPLSRDGATINQVLGAQTFYHGSRIRPVIRCENTAEHRAIILPRAAA